MKTIPIEEMKNGYDWQHAFHEACLGHCKPYDTEDIGPVKNVSEVITCSAGQNDTEVFRSRLSSVWSILLANSETHL